MDDVAPPPTVEAQALVPTPATTIDELMRAAYYVATGIDAPVCDVISPTHVNLHFPADGSLVSVKIEGRPGAWGGIGPHGTPEEEAARDAHYDECLAASIPVPPVLTARDEAKAREQAERQNQGNPVWEVQRQ